MWKRIAVVVLLVGVSSTWAQQNCNEQLTQGDETVQEAVPIATFATSGSDRIRNSWCVASCADKTSIIATMRFQPANTSALRYNVKSTYSRKLKKYQLLVTPKNGGGKPKRLDSDDGNDFCTDDDIANAVDSVLYNSQTNTDPTTIANALNTTINRAGWAFLVYKMGPPPSLVSTSGMLTDADFCFKTYEIQAADGSYQEFQVYAGNTYPD